MNANFIWINTKTNRTRKPGKIESFQILIEQKYNLLEYNERQRIKQQLPKVNETDSQSQRKKELLESGD